MPYIFSLTPSIVELARQAFDDLKTALEKPCRLYYPSITVPCNCGSNPIGKFPSNNWITGGTAPGSSLTNCSLCGGNGTTQQEVYEDINFLINESPKTFDNLPKGVLLPEGIIQTKAYLTQLPKIVKCEYMLSQTNIEGYQHRRYVLYGDPTDSSNIVKGYFVSCLWKRVS